MYLGKKLIRSLNYHFYFEDCIMRLKHSSSQHKILRALAAAFTTHVALMATWAEASSSTYYIEGIGYRE